MNWWEGVAGDQDDGSLSQAKENFQNEGTRSKNPNRQEPWSTGQSKAQHLEEGHHRSQKQSS